MSRSFDTYNFNNLDNNLEKLNQNINNLDNIDPLDFYYNIKTQYRKVSILKIHANNNEKPLNEKPLNEKPLIGKLSLEYFFENIFQNNKHLLFYYLLQDIEIYLKDMNIYDDNKITLINNIKKNLFSFINKK
jgi:hypothetical protein